MKPETELEKRLKEHSEKPHPKLILPSLKETPCSKKTDSIHESLKKIKEQRTEELKRLKENQATLNIIVENQKAIIELLKSRLDLDLQEQELMNMLKKKLK